MSSLPPKPSVTAEEERIGAIGADRVLSILHSPRAARPALEALWRIDSAMGDVVARAGDPALGRIKLAWWREALERLDQAPPPAEPRLKAIAADVLPLGIAGQDIARIEPGWATLLDPTPDSELVAARGATLFKLAARILGCSDERLCAAGSLWALAAVGRRGRPDLLDDGRQRLVDLRGHRFPAKLRSLSLLARLAARDLQQSGPLEPEGSPGRALAALRHRWSGRVFLRD